jgi:uncharacterized protein (TIGR03067 family)
LSAPQRLQLHLQEIAVLKLCCFLWLSLALVQESVTSKELQLLQGTWVGTSLQIDDNKIEREMPDMKLIIEGNSLTATALDSTSWATFTINPMATPKTMTIKYLARSTFQSLVHAIYKIEGDWLTIALTPFATAPPKSFIAEPGLKIVIETYRRINPVKK